MYYCAVIVLDVLTGAIGVQKRFSGSSSVTPTTQSLTVSVDTVNVPERKTFIDPYEHCTFSHLT